MYNLLRFIVVLSSIELRKFRSRNLRSELPGGGIHVDLTYIFLSFLVNSVVLEPVNVYFNQASCWKLLNVETDDGEGYGH